MIRPPFGSIDPNSIRETELHTESRRRHSRGERESLHSPQLDRERDAARQRAGCVPISPVDTTWQDGGTPVRTQLPLRLCWAITMHKSQGQTLDKAVIDLGPKFACTGLTFVCFL